MSNPRHPQVKWSSRRKRRLHRWWKSSRRALQFTMYGAPVTGAIMAVTIGCGAIGKFHHGDTCGGRPRIGKFVAAVTSSSKARGAEPPKEVFSNVCLA